MPIKKIIKNNLTLSIIIRAKDWQKGLNFFSSEEDFLQVGSWWYEKGKKIEPHIHLVCPKKALKTQEFVFVVQGKMRVNIYTEKEKFLKSIELKKGDTAIFLNGGHSFEILSKDTKVIEAKNGPYLGPEKDKRKFYEKEKQRN